MKRGGSVLLAILVLGALMALAMSPAVAQKKKKEPKGDQTTPLVKVPDGDRIETTISEMLAAWQIGDTELLHKYYADDVTVVSGAWEPPLVGWASFLKAYQSQRERMQGGRMDRRNTMIAARGNMAWAVYQWDFAAMVDGRQVGARGHTTLVLEKRGDRWLVAHNHTAVISETQPQAPTAPQPAKPGQ
jgi:ketosteroid isomerase-like protein